MGAFEGLMELWSPRFTMVDLTAEYYSSLHCVYTAPHEEVEAKDSPACCCKDGMQKRNSRKSTRFVIAFETADHNVTMYDTPVLRRR